MGVVGSGKTTVGQLLADELAWGFADADDFHPPSNIEKMRRGIALTDEDRLPWLNALREAIFSWIKAGRNMIVACSALKHSYRGILQAGPELRFVYLSGSAELIAARLKNRHGHFTGEQILASQLRDLEEPEDAIVVDIAAAPPQIVTEIRQKIGLS